MKIPTKIRLGGHDIHIELTPDRIQSSPYGFADLYRSTIVLNADRPEDIQAETFLHEIIEQINERYNLKLEHHAIVVISEQLFSIIRNNDLDFQLGDSCNQ